MRGNHFLKKRFPRVRERGREMGLFSNTGRGSLPRTDEMEAFGAAGEEMAYRALRASFSFVVRNPVIPHGNKFLEKDFLVVEAGLPFVIEIKNWKGTISAQGEMFRQVKADGTAKELKNPAGTTAQFVREMKQYYRFDGDVIGVVAFLDPTCKLDLPEEIEGIHLLPFAKLVSFIRTTAKRLSGEFTLGEANLLRCTRLYSDAREFSKGLLVDRYLPCKTRAGKKVALDTTKLKYITVKRRPFFLGYKLLVTFTNGSAGIFLAKDQKLVIGCLDGSFCRFRLGKLRYLVF